MEFQHLNVKLLVKNPEAVDLEAVVPVFHSWIQKQSGSELLLDVADYRHVTAGPGVVLIGHQGNYSLDHTGGRLGLLYNCKMAFQGSNQDRMSQATEAALAACQRLEAEPSLGGAVRFNGHDMEIIVNDRLLAPNTSQTRTLADPEFRAFFASLFGSTEYTVSYPKDSRSLFAVQVHTFQTFDATALLDTLNSRSLVSDSK